jgi:hypothetical protein
LHVDECPMIVTSNDFWQGCRDNGAREWIKKTSIYIFIDTKQHITN